MDHFPTIANPVYPQVKVPVLGPRNKRYVYDHQGFYGYPERAGFDLSALRMRKIPEDKSPDDVASFLQAWLFFGLFEEFFQFSWVIQPENSTTTLQDVLIKADENGEDFICTKLLTQVLPMWVDYQLKLENDLLGRYEDLAISSHRTKFTIKIQGGLLKIDRLLSEASEFVREVLFERGQIGTLLPFDVTLSIAILGETLSNARNLAYFIAPGSKQESIWTPVALALGLQSPWEREQLINSLQLPDPIGGAFLMPWGSVSCMTQRLKESKFCRSEIKFLQGYTISSAYFASRISRFKKGNHVNCTETKCIAYQVTSEYRPMHVDDDNCITSLCHFIEFETEKISSLLRRGVTPVVSVRSMPTDSQKVRVEIKDSTLVDQYVAISHVWSDGLGNPSANALYCCQLQRIQDMVNGLGSTVPSSDPIHFWVDTLCVPVHNVEDRRMALSNMAKYYSEASCVLVLDADLMACSTTVSPNELLMRVSLSTWMRRLWTLQEGALAQRLYFRFNDGTASLNGLVQDVGDDQTVADIYAHDPCFVFRRISRTIDDPKLLSIISILAHRRSTSKADDESICLAHLLGLDVGAIVRLPHLKRMEKIWASFQKVPISILRLKCPRLTTPGLRWAPETLINGPRMIESTHPLAEHVESGLIFRSPGYQLPGSVLDLSEDNICIELDYPPTIHLLDLEPMPMKIKNPILLIPDPSYIEHHEFLDDYLPHCKKYHCIIASLVRCMQNPDYIEVHHELDAYLVSLAELQTSNRTIIVPSTLKFTLLTVADGNSESDPQWLLT
jgi:hypothetical protein